MELSQSYPFNNQKQSNNFKSKIVSFHEISNSSTISTSINLSQKESHPKSFSSKENYVHSNDFSDFFNSKYKVFDFAPVFETSSSIKILNASTLNSTSTYNDNNAYCNNFANGIDYNNLFYTTISITDSSNFSNEDIYKDELLSSGFCSSLDN